MNKTININISGTVFNVDEDAYDLLYKYLESIKKYFSKIDADGEIVADIESRIAENFLSSISSQNNSISISDVKNVIKVMGTLDDFKEIYEDVDKEEESNTSEEKKTKRINKTRKKIKQFLLVICLTKHDHIIISTTNLNGWCT